MKALNTFSQEVQNRINDAANMDSDNWYANHSAGDYIEYRGYAEQYGLLATEAPVVIKPESFVKGAIQMVCLDAIKKGLTTTEELVDYMATEAFENQVANYVAMFQEEFGTMPTYHENKPLAKISNAAKEGSIVLIDVATNKGTGRFGFSYSPSNRKVVEVLSFGLEESNLEFVTWIRENDQKLLDMAFRKFENLN